jgi:hypothetical protein
LVIKSSKIKKILTKPLAQNQGSITVQPITIIDIDTFIFHQDIFRDRTIKLETVLDEYFKFTTFDTKRKYRDEEHAKQYVKRTVVPFSIFLSNYIANKKVRRVPKMLMEKGIKLFN